MSAPTQIVFTRIAITGLPELRCNVRMDSLGRTLDRNGDPLPMERRTHECGYDGLWLVGVEPLCERHFYEVCHLMEIDAADIEAEARSIL